jgi:ABC-type multidrug transport system fused ATPase/permease subunit
MIATSAGAVKLTINNSNLTGLAVVNVAGAGAQVEINNTKITNVDASTAEQYGAITVWSSAAGAKVVVNGGKITVGELLEFTLFLAYIYQPLRWISTLPRRLGEVATSLIKIFEVIDEKQSMEDIENPVPAELDGDIVFSDVRFGYKAYEPVLKDINLTVKQGEMIGLVGHSGAGKSTLINLIMRLYDADAGSITVGGKDIRDMRQTAYREKVGVVF